MLEWDKFREQHNIPFYQKAYKNVVYSDTELKEYYKSVQYLLTENIENYQLSYYKKGYDLYLLYLSFNKSELDYKENELVKKYIDWILVNQNPNVKAIYHNNEIEDKKFLQALRQHKKYKLLYYVGIILWMTSCFWCPFLTGFLVELINNFSITNATLCIAAGISYLLLWSFTMPITIPLSFIIGLIIHPKFLKFICFDKQHPYCEELMTVLKHSKNQEQQNTAAVMAGTILSNYIK